VGQRTQQPDPSLGRRRVLPYSYADRVVTPPVVCVGVVVLGALVAFLGDRVTQLAAAGVDPAPVLTFVTLCIGAVTSTATLVMQLLARAQTGRVEAEAGTAAAILRRVQNAQTPAAQPGDGAA